jgi:hypothetical protein
MKKRICLEDPQVADFSRFCLIFSDFQFVCQCFCQCRNISTISRFPRFPRFQDFVQDLNILFSFTAKDLSDSKIFMLKIFKIFPRFCPRFPRFQTILKTIMKIFSSDKDSRIFRFYCSPVTIHPNTIYFTIHT